MTLTLNTQELTELATSKGFKVETFTDVKTIDLGELGSHQQEMVNTMFSADNKVWFTFNQFAFDTNDKFLNFVSRRNVWGGTEQTTFKSFNKAKELLGL
mgnify:CR=1 FL=1|tara:strand:+ start:273 stop:569 length:297 start_codon:yes stop_codon:yes gene_type:complete